MNTFTPWETLQPELQARLHWAVRSCQEYEEASRFLFTPGVMGSPLGRFIESGRYVYVLSFFHHRDGAMRPLLIDLGWNGLLQTIEVLLTTPYGKTTFGELLAAFRNKVIAHMSFDLDIIRAELKRVHPGINDAILGSFGSDVADLFLKVEMVAHQLQKAYPQALAESPEA
jgi:hypothetical protein